MCATSLQKIGMEGPLPFVLKWYTGSSRRGIQCNINSHTGMVLSKTHKIQLCNRKQIETGIKYRQNLHVRSVVVWFLYPENRDSLDLLKGTLFLIL